MARGEDTRYHPLRRVDRDSLEGVEDTVSDLYAKRKATYETQTPEEGKARAQWQATFTEMQLRRRAKQQG
jgi:hypothetical protein